MKAELGRKNARTSISILDVTVFSNGLFVWVVVKIRVPFWIPNIIRHLIFRVPKRDPNFDNHPYEPYLMLRAALPQTGFAQMFRRGIGFVLKQGPEDSLDCTFPPRLPRV